jgi:hypothetical protein
VAKPFYHLRRNVEFVLTRGDNRLSRSANVHRRAIPGERRKGVLEIIGSLAVIPWSRMPHAAPRDRWTRHGAVSTRSAEAKATRPAPKSARIAEFGQLGPSTEDLIVAGGFGRARLTRGLAQSTRSDGSHPVRGQQTPARTSPWDQHGPVADGPASASRQGRPKSRGAKMLRAGSWPRLK